ncbi:MAG: hypothetical protein A3H01_00785 [Candidatus Wildermuthbacteria bacterium RIFCSPLOWO2_12_FULL_40_9]|uniref:Ligand-binding protein SH3 n=2 Tax=Candidatus Wildermuthiibacteriota TaxID=1817923 RepID=A0A1G2RDG6_9BACT|nr:MAG: hypothetical protein A3F15_02635 [Candidatus Wildermuthbacteria bacterium RIFCSPHIGHO2_12_FULL_40_12]OHA76798.1 MAG: hypothetical protein A3H01_00785 [Candidatus Wildermuthbacteria bacterium RIFCSPLOWO2_12_FULL_40_9]
MSIDFFTALPAWVKVFLLSMTPFGELRASVPIGLVVYKMNPVSVFFVSVMGNITAVLLILIFLGFISSYLARKSYLFNRFFAWLFTKTRDKHYDIIERYGIYALAVFVAIPLPFTGGWTGALIAFVFGIPFWQAFLSISIGVLVAGLLVLFVVQAGVALSAYFGWQALIGVAIVFWVGTLIYKQISKSSKNHEFQE